MVYNITTIRVCTRDRVSNKQTYHICGPLPHQKQVNHWHGSR